MDAAGRDGRTAADFSWAWFALVVLVALVLRLVRLDHAPHFDEFYHLLGAQSLLDDGDLCIAECLVPYDRGAPFTVLVAASLGIFGPSLVAGRMVSVVAGVLLVAGVYWWTWRAAGRTAAVAAGVLLALSPEAIYISQFIRFYSWHALLIWAGGAGLFVAVHPRDRTPVGRRWAAAGAGIAALLLALTLQVTTLIAAAALAAWLVLDPGLGWARREWGRNRSRLLAVAARAAVLAAVALVLMENSGLLGDLWAKYRSANLGTAAVADDIRFYHRFLTQEYPTFYTLLPVAFVIALWKRPAAALFTGVVFGVALILQSGGGFKATRFLFYAMPFFFALWGLALGVVLPPLAEAARSGIARWFGVSARSRGARAGGALLLAVVALCVLATNSAYNTTTKLLTVSDADWPASKPTYRGRPDWRPALEVLRAIDDSSDVMVTTSAVKALFYLDDVDAELSASRLFTGSGFAPDFARDPRTGLPVLRSPDGMARLIRCYDEGLVVIEAHTWATEWGVLPETAAYIAANTEEVPLPAGSDLRAFRWGGDGAAPSSCAAPPLSTPAEGRARG